jgi:hypothetical protein
LKKVTQNIDNWFLMLSDRGLRMFCIILWLWRPLEIDSTKPSRIFIKQNRCFCKAIGCLKSFRQFSLQTTSFLHSSNNLAIMFAIIHNATIKGWALLVRKRSTVREERGEKII